MVKTENGKLKDMVIEEHIQTRQIILKDQAEKTELLRNTIENVKGEIIKHLNQNQAELTIELKELVFKIILEGIDEYIEKKKTFEKGAGDVANKGIDQNPTTTKIDEQTENVSIPCRVKWTLQTPNSWHVRQIENALKGATLTLSNWFQVEFVYEGSLVIVTSASNLIFEDLEILISAIKSFLQYMINVCRLDTDTPETINVHFTMLYEREFLRMEKDLKRIDRMGNECNFELELQGDSNTLSYDDVESSSETQEREQLFETYYSSEMQCDTCRTNHLRKKAIIWCFECNQAFCSDCTNAHKTINTTKTHHPITVDDYLKLPPSLITINQYCDSHLLKLDFYCTDHESPLCVKCITDRHNTCLNVKSLNEIIPNLKKSASLVILEERFKEIMDISRSLIKDISSNYDKVRDECHKQRLIVDKERIAVYKHINKLENGLMRAIKVEREKENNTISRSVSCLNDILKNAKDTFTNIVQAKEYASGFHIFCAIKAWNDTWKSQKEKIDMLQKNLKLFECAEIKIDPIFLKLKREIEEFGFIVFKHQKPQITAKNRGMGSQAAMIPPKQAKNQLSKLLSFSLPGSETKTNEIRILGCCILDSGNMVFADHGNRRLLLVDSEGKCIKVILLPDRPCHVTSHDIDTVAMTYKSRLVLFDINHCNEIRTVYKGSDFKGLSYSEGKFVVANGYELEIIDLKGTILSTIKTNNRVWSCCIEIDTVYYASITNHSVYCCHMTGTPIWTFTFDNEFPCWIAVDSGGNVFVSSYLENKVFLIDKKGQNSNIVLTVNDKKEGQNALYFNKKSNMLLVCTLGEEKCTLLKRQ